MATQTIAIESRIPIPQPVYRYPLYDLEVGDSFLVPMPVGANSNTRRKFQVAVCLAVIRCRDKTGRQFTTKQEANGIRCWRLS